MLGSNYLYYDLAKIRHEELLSEAEHRREVRSVRAWLKAVRVDRQRALASEQRVVAAPALSTFVSEEHRSPKPRRNPAA